MSELNPPLSQGEIRQILQKILEACFDRNCKGQDAHREARDACSEIKSERYVTIDEALPVLEQMARERPRGYATLVLANMHVERSLRVVKRLLTDPSIPLGERLQFLAPINTPEKGDISAEIVLLIGEMRSRPEFERSLRWAALKLASDYPGRFDDLVAALAEREADS